MNKRLLASFACLILFAGFSWSQQKSDRQVKFAAFGQEMAAREQALAAAEKRGDLPAILAALDKDFLEIGGDGNRCTSADVARYFPDLHVNDVRFEDFQVQHVGRDAALLTYVAHVDAAYQASPCRRASPSPACGCAADANGSCSSIRPRPGRSWRNEVSVARMPALIIFTPALWAHSLGQE